MFFRLLGPLEVSEAGRSIIIGGGKRRALLALLLLHRDEIVPAEKLIDELWGEHPPATAAKGLQVHVSQLRKELSAQARSANGGPLVTGAHGYGLRVGQRDLDIRCFEAALADGERALAGGASERAAARLREGLAMWRGPPLSDFTYDPFAGPEIARLEELHLVALERRIDADLALGRHAALVGELEGLVGEHPFREDLRARLMLSLYRCGRQADALQAFREARDCMVDELGLEPGPGLRDLEAKVLAHSPELAPPDVAPAPAPAPSEPAEAPRTRRGPLSLRLAALVAAAALMLGAAAVAAMLRSTGDRTATRAPALDLAPNSLVAIDVAARKPSFAVPLPGRPSGIAAAHGRVFVVTVKSSALLEVDGRSRAIVRTVSLPVAPAAVADGEGGVWIADARGRQVVLLRPGYQESSARIALKHAAAHDGRSRPTSIAAGGGAVWLTDGSAQLTRIDPRTHAVTTIAARHPLNGVIADRRAVWAISAKAATVVRVDPVHRRITDAIPIVARGGVDAPRPIGIAATKDAVWVLNANTANLSVIDPVHRGVVSTVPVGVDRQPTAVAAAGATVWVANFDGSLSRIDPGRHEPASVWVGESLDGVAADGPRLWVLVTSLDRQLPGGAG